MKTDPGIRRYQAPRRLAGREFARRPRSAQTDSPAPTYRGSLGMSAVLVEQSCGTTRRLHERSPALVRLSVWSRIVAVGRAWGPGGDADGP